MRQTPQGSRRFAGGPAALRPERAANSAAQAFVSPAHRQIECPRQKGKFGKRNRYSPNAPGWIIIVEGELASSGLVGTE